MQQMFKAGAETLQTVRDLATSLKGTAGRVDRIAKEVETGKGWFTRWSTTSRRR